MTIITYVFQFLWTPYETLQIRWLINHVEVSMIVHVKLPLLCFPTVEWHVVNRVIKQFRQWKNILNDPPNIDELHDIGIRGRTNICLSYHHCHWVNKWNHWNDYIIQGEMDHGTLHENSEYMQWYICWTRRYIFMSEHYLLRL